MSLFYGFEKALLPEGGGLKNAILKVIVYTGVQVERNEQDEMGYLVDEVLRVVA